MITLRHTSQRQRILFAVKAEKGLLTARQVLAVVRKVMPRIGAATVYRNLDSLCSRGELFMVDGDDGRRQYVGHAHHEALFRCQRCKNVRRLNSKTLDDYVQRKMFGPQTIMTSRLTASGLCTACTKRLKRL